MLAEYGSDFYQGTPVLTRNKFGEGQAYYVASSPDSQFLTSFLGHLCDGKGIKPLLDTPVGVEVSERVKDNISYLFVLNHNAEEAVFYVGEKLLTELLTGQEVSGEVTIPGRDVMILERVAKE